MQYKSWYGKSRGSFSMFAKKVDCIDNFLSLNIYNWRLNNQDYTTCIQECSFKIFTII